jgi:hypothetical protein
MAGDVKLMQVTKRYALYHERSGVDLISLERGCGCFSRAVVEKWHGRATA